MEAFVRMPRLCAVRMVSSHAAAVALVRGGYYRSALLEKMAFGSYNKRIEDPISPWDWLSRDPDAVCKRNAVL